MTYKSDRKGLRHMSMGFTEQGVDMLSSILNSPGAIEINIEILRTFVNMRKPISFNLELKENIMVLE